MNESLEDLSRLLNQFRHSKTRILSSKELRDGYGRDWRDAVAQLQIQGYSLEQIVGGNGNVSYRLSTDELANMVPKERKVELSRFDDPNDPLLPMRLRLSDIRALLRTDVVPRVRDALVGAVIAHEEKSHGGY